MKHGSIVVTALLAVLLLVAPSCKKKTQSIARAPVTKTQPTKTSKPDAAAPTIELTASPSTVKRGQETTLTWKAKNAESVLLDGGIGNVGTDGSVTVTPLESITYTATASGSGGEAKASTRVTVVRSDDAPVVKETELEGLRRAIEDGRVSPVYFAYDSAELNAEGVSILEENARLFRQFPSVQVSVEGHCDERGTEEYNLALGDRRAQTVKDYLVQLGVSANRLNAISFGEERPFVEGHNEGAWAKNRRAHFSVR